MNLWIRTQEKRLFQIIDILEPRETEKSSLKGGWGLYGFSPCGSFIVLGYYKSEERALEVLDEIERILEDNIIATNDDGYVTVLENTKIYEMPKE